MSHYGQVTVLPLYADLEVPCLGDRETTTEMDETIGLKVTNVAEPELHYYRPVPRAASDKAVMILPGGGYVVQAWDHEGVDIARYLSSEGYHAFVLRYRLPGQITGDCKDRVALQDAQRAMLLIRQYADSLGYDAHAVGVMGFSAGGHLAGSVSVHETIEGGLSSRPDFSVLVYPVLRMDEQRNGHAGSQRALLGDNPDPDRLAYYNLPEQVDAETPPTLLVHASDDAGVSPLNSTAYYEALIANGVAADLRIYAHGGHGFGSARELSYPTRAWLEEVTKWIASQ
jgi:acetyl esterase/lipase